jgi:hypothetical protein
MDAQFAWKTGERRKTPKGDLLVGCYRDSYCSFKLQNENNLSPAELIHAYNSKFIL